MARTDAFDAGRGHLADPATQGDRRRRGLRGGALVRWKVSGLRLCADLRVPVGDDGRLHGDVHEGQPRLDPLAEFAAVLFRNSRERHRFTVPQRDRPQRDNTFTSRLQRRRGCLRHRQRVVRAGRVVYAPLRGLDCQDVRHGAGNPVHVRGRVPHLLDTHLRAQHARVLCHGHLHGVLLLWRDVLPGGHGAESANGYHDQAPPLTPPP
mmetsp:Transcript_27996/g.94288  ORF Transcript_27996/g.94288 Transcript_27996/m.94288 type:complete len:208 (+) Transcript_27996:517-1140(+)